MSLGITTFSQRKFTECNKCSAGGYSCHNNYLYQVKSGTMGYSEAKALCQSDGANPFSVKNEQRYTTLMEILGLNYLDTQTHQMQQLLSSS